MSSVWPILHYDDPEAMVSFLADVLGFRRQLVVRDDGGEIIHAELSWPGGGVVNLGGTRHLGGVHGGMRPGTNAAYVITADVDGICERVRRAGRGRVVHAAADTTFAAGAIPARACTIADLEGNLWTFGTYAGATASAAASAAR
ncbi:MAG: VOC family protein [Vicinamibacterales bacterium]